MAQPGEEMPTANPPQFSPAYLAPMAVPPGLENLAAIGQINIKQRINLMELMLPVEMKNNYVIKNINDEFLYDAMEDTTFRTRMMCNRPFTIHFFDHNRVPVLKVSRPWRGCCPSIPLDFCLQILTVSLPSDVVIGYVKQKVFLLNPRFSVQNASGDIYMTIEGPYCLSKCGRGDWNFKVFNLQREEVGVISKKWGGIAREYVTDADYFSVSFGENMNIAAKATLMGAAILIDFLFFESPKGPQPSVHV